MGFSKGKESRTGRNPATEINTAAAIARHFPLGSSSMLRPPRPRRLPDIQRSFHKQALMHGTGATPANGGRWVSWHDRRATGRVPDHHFLLGSSSMLPSPRSLRVRDMAPSI